jgi:hypothetical protein
VPVLLLLPLLLAATTHIFVVLKFHLHPEQLQLPEIDLLH